MTSVDRGLLHACHDIDTYRDAPEDVSSWEVAPVVQDVSYVVQPRSLVTLFAERKAL